MNVRTALAAAIAAALLGAPGCGEKEQPYTPKPSVSGKKPTLPAVPSLPTKAKKEGDAYTIYGATHDLRSRVHAEDVVGKKITIVGYIVKTNYGEKCPDKNGPPPAGVSCVPECAIHKTGKADPTECKSTPPTFSIADSRDEKKDMIDVMGWASNFAQLYNVMEKIDTAPKGKESEVKVDDEFWSVALPVPVPNVGAKVKVTGTYGVTFTRSTGGAAANPKYGILTAEKIEYLEPPPEKAYLPGMKRKP